ncbi:hypothetical protein Tco_1145137 [Tanacetum coccineum]
MNESDLTMEKYIELHAEKAQRRGQTFNWETTTYGKIYCDDFDLFISFDADFPAIVYNDALIANQDISFEPTITYFRREARLGWASRTLPAYLKINWSLLSSSLSKFISLVCAKAVVEESYVTCGGAHAYYSCPNTDNNQSSVCAATGAYNQVAPPNRVSNHMAPPGFAPVQNNGQNSNTIPNPKGEMKSITTRSGVAYEGYSIPTNPSPKKVVERETEETMDKEKTNFQRSTTHIPPPVNPILILEHNVLKTLPKPNIPYPSRLNDQKFCEKASNQMEKIF